MRQIKNKKYLGLLMQIVLFILFSGILLLQGSFGEDINNTYESRLKKLVTNGGYIATKEGKQILAYNPYKQFIPASIWKIVTSLAALDTFGEGYRFKTGFYLDRKNNLFIKGFGDPFLVSEEVDLIFKEFKTRGIVEINNIYLDSSTFVVSAPPGVNSSLNPYDVTNGALAVNFNTVNFYVDENGIINSAENQTPTLKLMKELGRGFKKGKHRINISGSHENVSRYTGELFRALQFQNKIPGTGFVSNRRTPSDLPVFYIHYSSKTLKEIIQAMMLYSNNYTANQIYLTLGAHEYGYPATWEKSQKFLRQHLLKNLPEYSGLITFDEGSGISRNNRITARAMIDVLEKFKPYARLLPFENSMYLKSGTLRGVYSYAGYFVRENGYDSFVIMLNQKNNARNKILKLIEQCYNGIP